MRDIVLPPIPDTFTGEPRPPTAPRIASSASITSPSESHRRHPADPPAEFGPRLEWTHPTKGAVRSAPLVLGLIMAAYLTITQRGVGWIVDPGYWVIFVVVAILMVLSGRRIWIAAGSRWVQSGKLRVDTYELVNIDVSASGPSRVLDIEDASGHRHRSISLRYLQENQALWDLVYNGILHSAMSGKCHVSDRAIKFLQLPDQLYRQ